LPNVSLQEESAGSPSIAAGFYWSDRFILKPILPLPYSDFGYATQDIRLQTRPTANNQILAGRVYTMFETDGGELVLYNYSGSGYIESRYYLAQAPVPAVPAVPYIAPSETGGPYTGASVTATLNSVTKTWIGGYYTTPPVSATYALTSTGAGQTLSYNVPSGGQLYYEYAF
jgi:hypothetical protein